MIAARLFQMRDRERALELYSDVIATILSLEELRKLEGVSQRRCVIMFKTFILHTNFNTILLMPVFTRISAAALIKFFAPQGRRLLKICTPQRILS